MKHPLNFLLRLGRSEADRVSLLGDLEEERRARVASGRGRRSTFVWHTGQIMGAFAYGVRDFLQRWFRIFSWPDLKLSFRLLFKHPGLTLVASFGIAVGIAISAGSFAFFYSQLYPTLPLDEGDRIVALENWNIVKDNEDRHVLHDFVTWRDQMTTVVEIGAFRRVDAKLQFGTRQAETVRIAAMTASGFVVARVPALKGRFLTPEDERADADPVLVIGHDVWRSRFAQDPSVVGQQVRIGKTIHTVVGVMPEGFTFPVNHQYWVPLRANPLAFERGAGPELFVFGRLAPGATTASAQAELEPIGQRTASAFPQTHADLKPHVVNYTYSITDIQDADLEFWVLTMQLMMSLVLVVVALNVAILVYARTAHRLREIALRTALGAGRLRIVTQLFGEALALALVPAIIGLALAQYALRLGWQILEREGMFGGSAPFWADYSVQPATILYIVALVVLTAGIVGILPALQATRRSVAGDIRQLGGTGVKLGRTWGLLIVAQVAIAVAALPAAVNMGLSQIRSALTGPAHPIEEFLGLTVTTEAGSDRLGSRLTELKRRVQGEPDVAGVTFAAVLPGRDGARIELVGPGESVVIIAEGLQTWGIDTDYLNVHGSRLLTGRPFEARDASDVTNPVIVDRTFVRKFLNGGPAVGRRFRYAAGGQNAEPSPWFEIVGVTENLRSNPIDPDILRPVVFYPVTAEQVSTAAVRVRVRGSAASRLESGLTPRLHQIAAAVDPGLRLGDIRASAGSSQEDIVVRLVALAVSLVIVTVLLLSAAGVYALMSFTVAQRRREIGIRTALGAPRHRVLQSIFSRVALQVGLGVLAGIAGAVIIESATGGFVLSGPRVVVIPVIALIMLAVGFFAAVGPARRGLRIQPTEALRAE